MGLRLVVGVFALFLSGCATLAPTQLTASRLQTLQQLQTLPEEWIIPGEELAEAQKRLLAWVNRQKGMTAEETDLPKGFAGRTRIIEGSAFIQIQRSHGANMRFATLVHEIAHVFQCPCLSREAGEVFAELIATQVTQAMGLDISVYTAAYFYHAIPMEVQRSTSDRFAKDMDRIVPQLVKVAKGEK